MENYIVRIYRRDNTDPDRINGVLESVEQETRQPFASLNSLRTMLSSGPMVLKAEPESPDNNKQPTLELAK